MQWRLKKKRARLAAERMIRTTAARGGKAKGTFSLNALFVILLDPVTIARN
ncbi:hypothetical protein BSG1_02135 [Bacillus sp. SG-1]|nr:hypothetical protein BSG1_02135 [Bacillus sp. SG-1]